MQKVCSACSFGFPSQDYNLSSQIFKTMVSFVWEIGVSCHKIPSTLRHISFLISCNLGLFHVFPFCSFFFWPFSACTDGILSMAALRKHKKEAFFSELAKTTSTATDTLVKVTLLQHSSAYFLSRLFV